MRRFGFYGKKGTITFNQIRITPKKVMDIVNSMCSFGSNKWVLKKHIIGYIGVLIHSCNSHNKSVLPLYVMVMSYDSFGFVFLFPAQLFARSGSSSSVLSLIKKIWFKKLYKYELKPTLLTLNNSFVISGHSISPYTYLTQSLPAKK